MKFRSHCVQIVLLLMCPLLSVAQEKRPQVIGNPEFDIVNRIMMLKGNVDVANDKFLSKDVMDETWTVFSDRASVKYYKDKKCSSAEGPVGSIGTMLEVHDENKTAVFVHRDGKELGWVKKSELVLWSTPLVKKNMGVDIKAFIVNIKENKWLKDFSDNTRLKEYYRIYDSPETSSIRDEQPIYQILFVYKYDKASDRYLLGQQYKLNDSGQILGWVNRNRVKIWDTSVALEPNWEIESMKERKANEQFRARVFQTDVDARGHMAGKNIQELATKDPAAIPENEIKEFGDLIIDGRYSGEIPRFPYFSITGDIIECGAIGKTNINSLDIMDGTSERRMARMRKKLEARQSNLKSTNVVFVVDGTVGMAKHIRKTISNAADRIRAGYPSDQRNNLKFGMVIYVDGQCGDGLDRFIKKQITLTNDIEDFKRRSSAYGSHTSIQDGDYYVASRLGLKVALDNLGLKKDETNIIFHLGSAVDQSFDDGSFCDDLPIIDEQALHNTLYSKRPAIVSIQVQTIRGREEFDYFEDDMADLMIETSEAINIKEPEKFAFFNSKESVNAETVQRDGHTEILNSPSYMAIHTPSSDDEDGKMDEVKVADIVEAGFKRCIEYRDEQLAMINKLFHDNGTIDKALPEFSPLQASMFSDLSQDELKLLVYERVHFFSQSFTYLHHSNSNYDSYKYVLFLRHSTVQALDELYSSFDESADRVDVSEQRNYLAQALKKYARSMLNLQTLDDDVEIDLKTLRTQITGVRDNLSVGTKGDLMSRLTSWDDINSLSESEITSLYSDLRAKGREFKELINVKGGYPYIMHTGQGEAGKSPELQFYWIPIENIF